MDRQSSIGGRGKRSGDSPPGGETRDEAKGLQDLKQSYRVQALERAIDILDCFTYERRELNLREIVMKTGLNRSTARRLVSNLEFRGMLQQDTATKNYRLGLHLFELGGIVFSSFSLRRAAAQPMSRLEDRVGATTLLALKLEDRFVLIDKREGRGMVAMPSEIARRRPLSFGPMGRVFMSYMDDREVKGILKKHPLRATTPYTITDKKMFLKELIRVKKDGFAIDVEEVAEGIMGIAAPVLDYSAQPVAALCLGLPASMNKNKKEVKRVLELLLKTCDEISSNLGYLKRPPKRT